MSDICKIYFEKASGEDSQYYTFGRIVSEYGKKVRLSNDKQTFKNKRCFVVDPIHEHHETSVDLNYRLEQFVTLNNEDDIFKVWKTAASE